jgi:hypothetical protein
MNAAYIVHCPLKFFDMYSYDGEERLWLGFVKLVNDNMPKPGAEK